MSGKFIPKFECRISKQVRMLKPKKFQITGAMIFLNWNLLLVSDFGIRASDLARQVVS